MKHVQHMIGFSALALSGCSFDEGLRERDITGVVRIPVEALTTLELVDPDGTPIMQAAPSREPHRARTSAWRSWACLCGRPAVPMADAFNKNIDKLSQQLA